MTDRTTHLRLPFILPAQAQKHVTHNEALLRLDGIVHLAVKDELATPPAAPSDGDCYLVADAATDAWNGRAGLLAIRQDGAWDFAEPMEGWRAWFIPTRSIRVFSDGLWQDALPSAAHFEELGIGATADAFNRLAVSSPASLFNHAGEGHQIKVNKESAAQTASLLFQSGWTGHAEMGLAGNNDFSIKVSDGSDWKTGLAITATGQVRMPNQPLARAYRAGTVLSPIAGQQSGFDTFGLNQGGFTFAAAAPGGGNWLAVPASGAYLACLTTTVATSSGHEITLLTDDNSPLLSLTGAASTSGTQSASGIFTLEAGSLLALGHAGTVQLQIGAGRTELSLALL